MLTCFARMPDGSFEHHDSLDAVCRLATECESSLWIDLGGYRQDAYRLRLGHPARVLGGKDIWHESAELATVR